MAPMRFTIAFAACAWLLASSAPAAEPASDFDAAVTEAKNNTKSPEGAEYDQVFGKSFAEKHKKTLVLCVEGLKGKDLDPFDIVARVAPNGRLESLGTRPQTKVATCLARRMKDDSYPPPPKPRWWVHIRMTIRP